MYAEVYEFTRFAYYFLIIMDRWGRMGTRSSFIRVIRSSAVKKEKRKVPSRERFEKIGISSLSSTTQD